MKHTVIESEQDVLLCILSLVKVLQAMLYTVLVVRRLRLIGILGPCQSLCVIVKPEPLYTLVARRP